VIADGMGGHRAGELAAQIAVERIPAHFAAAQSELKSFGCRVLACCTDRSKCRDFRAGSGT
jgi:serine/threonine protein phosphatase PrpC